MGVRRLLLASSHFLTSARFNIVQFLVIHYSRPLFVHTTNSYCLHLCSLLLRCCTSPNGVIRAKATAYFFLMMKVCYLSQVFLLSSFFSHAPLS